MVWVTLTRAPEINAPLESIIAILVNNAAARPNKAGVPI
jgi:hypothetical protein